MKERKAAWVGVLVIGGNKLDCRLFSMNRRANRYPVVMVHRECNTVLNSDISEKQERQIPVRTKINQQPFCPVCQRPVKTDEIGRALITNKGIIFLSDAELDGLKPKPSKRFEADHFIPLDDPMIQVVGIGRRFYVLPKPAAVGTYSEIFYNLENARAAAFIPEMVIGKSGHPAIVRPFIFPEEVFGVPRQVLLLELLKDSDTLVDPGPIMSFRSESSQHPNFREIINVEMSKRSLHPKNCVDPSYHRLKNLVKGKIEGI